MKNFHTSNRLIAFILLSMTSLTADTIQDSINLWPDLAPGSEKVSIERTVEERSEDPSVKNRLISNIQTPKIDVYLPENPNGTSVIIFPGGGYTCLSYDHEGIVIAKHLNQQGIAAFILSYRLPAEGHEKGNLVPLQDAQRAMRIIRNRAPDWGLDSHKIGVMGFSAGGHAASTLATLYNQEVYSPIDEVDAENARPDFLILMYPVISMEDGVAHKGSKSRLLGPDPVFSLIKQHSNELLVDEKTPPTFIALATDDTAVVAENSIRFFRALIAAGVPVELHSFEKGGHGFGIRHTKGPNKIWTELLSNWMISHDL